MKFYLIAITILLIILGSLAYIMQKGESQSQENVRGARPTPNSQYKFNINNP